MKKIIISLLFGSILFAACRKQSLVLPQKTCTIQTDNPANRSYSSDSLIAFDYSGKQCGFLPLNRNDYWIYEDSIFIYGTFLKIQYDTLQFKKTYLSLSDNLIWWQTNIEVGLPDLLYSSDSSIFELSQRLFSSIPVWDTRKEYTLFSGESANYLANFDDIAAQGKSLKLDYTLTTPAGNFNNCIQFEKNARSYREDEVYFKPGLGVIRYTLQEAPMGSHVIKLLQISTLIKFHIE